MAHVINFTSQKHGVGTSTVAALTAFKLSRHYNVVLVDSSQSRDMTMWMGGHIPSDTYGYRLNDSLWFSYPQYLSSHMKVQGASVDYVVVDSGVDTMYCDWMGGDSYQTVIVTDNSYVSLAKIAKGVNEKIRRECVHVCVVDPERPLTAGDARNVLNPALSSVLIRSSRIGRMQDGGTFASHHNTQWTNEYADQLINDILSIQTTK